MEECNVKHVKATSTCILPRAQFESILQLVGLAQALLALYTSVSTTFGIPIPHKNTEETS